MPLINLIKIKKTKKLSLRINNLSFISKNILILQVIKNYFLITCVDEM